MSRTPTVPEEISPHRRRPRHPHASVFTALAVLALAAALGVGCGPPEGGEAVEAGEAAAPESGGEVMVFAAASLRDAIQEAGALYEQRRGLTPVYNFAGSNELARQVLAAPQADVFVSANEKWMDEVETGGRVAAGTRSTLLSNRLVVIARTDSPHLVATPGSLATLPYRHLVLANPDAVPAGTYAREWLESRPGPGGGTLWAAVEGKVAPTLDVRAALALVETDPELIGIVYRTDAASSDRVHVLYEVPAAEGPDIRYAVGAIEGGPNPAAGRGFVEFLRAADAAAVFERHGFVVGTGETPAGVAAETPAGGGEDRGEDGGGGGGAA